MNYFKLIACFVFIGYLLPQHISAQDNKEWQKLLFFDVMYYKNLGEYGRAYVPFMSDDIKDYHNRIEETSYPSDNLFDGDFTTCWVCGSSKTNKNAALYVILPDSIDLNEIILNIFAGYGKSKVLFYANARPGKIRLTLFAAFNPEGGFATELGFIYIMKRYPLVKDIELADTSDVQSIALNLDKKDLLDFRKKALEESKTLSDAEYKDFANAIRSGPASSCFVLKMEIPGSYAGTKYDDICISELFFNDRFITPYPDKYSEALNFYIKDDNILLADYADKKGVVIYKDTLSTMNVEISKNKKWAILLYVLSDEVAEGSRVEQLYSLIDLKNREIVDSKFEKSTGHSTMYILFEEDDEGNVFIKEEKYNIELR